MKQEEIITILKSIAAGLLEACKTMEKQEGADEETT